MHLYRILQNQGLRIQRYNFTALHDVALKNNLIDNEDAKNIGEIRNIRNGAIHTVGIEISKGRAQKAIDIVRDLIKKNTK